MPWIDQLSEYQTHPILLAVLIFLGTLLSEDLACITGGLLAAKGWLPLPMAIGASSLGILTGDIGLYFLGRLSQKGGSRWRWLKKIVSEERVSRGRALFDRYGTRWIFLSRFLPGSRLPSYVAAGAVGWSFKRFASVLAVAVALWTPVLVSLTYYFGQKTLFWLESYQRWAWPVMLTLVVSLLLLTKLVVPAFTWRGRRLLAGRWRRLRRWEYWSPALVYPSVVLPLLLRPLRGRRMLDFLSSNPAIPLSGFAMESKGDILESLVVPQPAEIRIADYVRLSSNSSLESRLSEVVAFAANRGWPVVLKPDIGERGKGVSIVRNREEAKEWLSEHTEQAAMVQEYVSGLEFGIQWSRYPNLDSGEITSIARKLPQSLIGNGVDSIERLILLDPRASAMAPHFFNQFAARLQEIPSVGKEVVLTELGTHCLGAVFEDARHLITPELSATLDAIGLASEGINFGRYDLRVSDEASLKRGESLVVLELNGVTGEPAHIYQPGYPLLKGLSDLRRHYGMASDIGALNIERGEKRASWKELLATVNAHRKKD